MKEMISPCKDCVVDMICTQQCPMFEIDLERLQTNEDIYLNRCMNNIAVIWSDGNKRWYKNGVQYDPI